MIGYILKRLLLIIPILLGVMQATFAVAQFVPGGPIEKLVADIDGWGQCLSCISS